MEGQISVEYFNTIRETRYEREDLNLQALLQSFLRGHCLPISTRSLVYLLAAPCFLLPDN